MARSRAARAADPATPLVELAALAHEHPQVRAIVAANPSAYPDLLDWLAALGDPEVDAALASRTAGADVSTGMLRASDPATPQEELAQLAYGHPELRATIAANPNAYDDLRAWIAENDSSEVPGATTTVHAPRTRTEADAATPAAAPAPKAPRAILGLTAAQLALIAGALVLGLVAAGSVVYSATLVPGTITAISTGDTSGLPGGGGGTASGGSGGSGNVPVVAPEPRYVPTVLILDASGSMVRDVAPGVTRMDAARTAATTLVDGFGEDAQVGLTVFGTSTGNSDAERAAGCSDIRRLVPVGPIDKSALTSAISGIVQSGFTPIGPSLRDAVDQLAGADEGLIVVVSDGVDTCAPPSSCDVAAELRSAHPEITIHAVGFAVDADEQAQENLECVAQAGGGTYVDAANADQLAARLRALTDPFATAGTIGVAGIDAVELGMSRDQVEAVLGDLGAGEVILDIEYVGCPYGVLQFKDGRLWGIEPLDSITTSEGLAVGDDLDAATAIYGSSTAGSDDLGDYQLYLAAPGSGTAYRVYYDGPKIIKIVVCLCTSAGGGFSEISNWQVSFDGLGPLDFDTTYTEANEILGTPVDPSTDRCLRYSLGTSGLAAQIAISGSDEPDLPIASYGFGASALGAASFPRTDRGVGLGSTADEWLAAYPGSTRVYDQSIGAYLILTDATGISLIGGLADDGSDVVDFVQVGRETTLLGYLGCD